MTQLALLPSARPSGGDVTDEIVARLPSMLAAIKLCQDVSGLHDQQVSDQLGLDSAQWSRIKSGNMHFPPNKVIDLMDICGNEIPLRWLAMRRGYELKRRLSAVEEELERERTQRRELEERLAVITQFMRSIGR